MYSVLTSHLQRALLGLSIVFVNVNGIPGVDDPWVALHLPCHKLGHTGWELCFLWSLLVVYLVEDGGVMQG